MAHPTDIQHHGVVLTVASVVDRFAVFLKLSQSLHRLDVNGSDQPLNSRLKGVDLFSWCKAAAVGKPHILRIIGAPYAESREDNLRALRDDYRVTCFVTGARQLALPRTLRHENKSTPLSLAGPTVRELEEYGKPIDN
ncbi:hypothetical protein AC1031_016853 [Aphanomyces cochlioides]|nr:hypothetical protein AC1031_016853 [Aphanomyces cochlioides]